MKSVKKASLMKPHLSLPACHEHESLHELLHPHFLCTVCLNKLLLLILGLSYELRDSYELPDSGPAVLQYRFLMRSCSCKERKAWKEQDKTEGFSKIRERNVESNQGMKKDRNRKIKGQERNRGEQNSSRQERNEKGAGKEQERKWKGMGKIQQRTIKELQWTGKSQEWNKKISERRTDKN
jgi:hypothetical protein